MMSLVEFVLFVVGDVAVTLFLRRFFFFKGCGGFRAFLLKIFTIVMVVVYVTIIGGGGVISVALNNGGGYVQELVVVHGGSFVMVLFHAWIAAYR
ncbi:hypothetical protein [Pseudomonas sp. NPDC089406]|uniref:hypothetical protein n=1 Tax=Pseudomonas sp. NPDC089406 TaxID=3364463 RepID=UPI00384FA8EC